MYKRQELRTTVQSLAEQSKLLEGTDSDVIRQIYMLDVYKRQAQAGSSLTGGSLFSAPAERGTRTAAGVFAPDGRRVFR